MFNLFKKHTLSIIISLLIILALVVVTWVVPAAGRILWVILLLSGLTISSYMIVKKHREEYLQGNISRVIFVRNVFLEITGVLLTMVLAAVLGRYLVILATSQMHHDIIRFITGIIIGLSVGIAVGISIKQLSLRLVKTT